MTATACQYRTIAPGVHQCETCGHRIKTNWPPEHIHRVCDGPPPGIGRRALRFASAVVRHVRDLGRRRTPWEIRAIHKICKACPHYMPTQPRPLRWWERLFRILPADGACRLCGCQIDSRAAKWLNKLAWRSEQCADNPPRWR